MNASMTSVNDLHPFVPAINPTTVSVLVAVFTAFIIGLRLHHTSRRPSTPLLNGPLSTSFFFGVIRELFDAPDLGVIYQAWEKAYGLVYQIPAPIGSRQLILGDPKAIAHFFAKDTVTYQQSKLARLLSQQSFGDILVVMEGETHKRQRRALSPAFSVSAIRQLTSVFLESAHELISSWNALIEEPSTQGKPFVVDVQKWLNYVSLDSIGKGGFSHNFESLKGKTSPIMNAVDSFGSIRPSLGVMLLFVVGPRFPWLISKIPNNRQSKILELSKCVKEIAGALLEKAAKEKEMGLENDKSMIGTLLRSGTASSNIHMSIEEVVAQMHLLIIAGYETTSTTLTWALIELSRRPEIQDKLRAELRQQLGGEDPTYDQLTNGLPYLDAFTSEVLRFHPAAPEIARVATEDDTLPLTDPITAASGAVIDSLFIAKGTTIRIPIAGVNRSESLWGTDADKFDPERWLITDELEKARKEKVQGYRNLLTFASGPRVCLGRNFALTEFKAVLSVIIRRFCFEMPGGLDTKIESHRGILVRPKVAGQEGPKVPLIVRKVGPE